MLDKEANMGNLPQKMQDLLRNNVEGVRELIENTFGEEEYNDPDDPPQARLLDMIGGGVRMGGADLDNIRQRIPALQKREFVMNLIEKLYEGVGNYEQQGKMSQAYDTLKNQPEAPGGGSLLKNLLIPMTKDLNSFLQEEEKKKKATKLSLRRRNRVLMTRSTLNSWMSTSRSVVILRRKRNVMNY